MKTAFSDMSMARLNRHLKVLSQKKIFNDLIEGMNEDIVALTGIGFSGEKLVKEGDVEKEEDGDEKEEDGGDDEDEEEAE